MRPRAEITVGVDGDDAGGWRAGPTRAAARSSSAATPTGRRAPRPRRRSTSGPASTSTAAAPYVVDGDLVVFSDFADGRLYRLDPASGRRCRSRRRAVALRRPALRSGPPAGSSPSARTTSRRRRQPMPRTSTSPLDWRAASRRSSSTAPTSSRRRGSRRMARRSPGSSGTTRTCRGTARSCGSPRSRRTARSGASDLAAGGPEEWIVQPAGRPTASSISSRDRTAGGTSTASTDGPRLEPLAPLEAEFAGPDWLFGLLLYAFLPDGSIVAIARAAAATGCIAHRAGRLVGEIESAVHRDRGPALDGATGSSRWRRSPDEAAALVELDPATLAPLGRAPPRR